MPLRVIGAGFGRTGTMSLKFALERLLDAPCYHMMELFREPQHVPLWHQAALGNPPDWDEIFNGFAATVDHPGAAFYPELMNAYPDALVLLSYRDSESWWNSANETIFPMILSRTNPLPCWQEMIEDMMRTRFTADLSDKDACIAAYERHNSEVRATVPPNRLIEWKTGEGWQPLCDALGLPVPDEPFPHNNTTEEFNARARPQTQAAS